MVIPKVEGSEIKKHVLPRTEILKGSSEIRELFARGLKRKYGKIKFIYVSSDVRKAGFIASRKSGCAVKRNRARRILREAYRMNRDKFKGMKIILYTEEGITLKEAVEAINRFKEGG